MPTHEIEIKYQHSNEQHTKTVSKTAAAELNLEETIPDASTDLEINLDIDVSALKSLLISSDQDLTIETNDGTTPADTLTPTADEPIIWWDGSEFSHPLGTDVTSIFVTNASGNAATLVIKVLQDPTP